MSSFWNKIGLPSVADIEKLMHICQQRSQCINDLEQEVTQLKADLVVDMAKTEELFAQNTVDRTTQADTLQQLSAMLSEYLTQLESWKNDYTTKSDVLQNKNTRCYNQLLDTVSEFSKNQDELLRILIVNSLGDEMQKILSQSKNPKQA